jgi:hypothetical protein
MNTRKKETLHDAFGGVLVESVLSGVIGYLYNGTERNGTELWQPRFVYDVIGCLQPFQRPSRRLVIGCLHVCLGQAYRMQRRHRSQAPTVQTFQAFPRSLAGGAQSQITRNLICFDFLSYLLIDRSN